MVRTPSEREESNDYIGRFGDHQWEQTEMCSPRRPGAMSSLLSTSKVNTPIKRKPVPGNSCPPMLYEPRTRATTAIRRPSSSRESFGELNIVESDFLPQPPPKVGPKPVG